MKNNPVRGSYKVIGQTVMHAGVPRVFKITTQEFHDGTHEVRVYRPEEPVAVENESGIVSVHHRDVADVITLNEDQMLALAWSLRLERIVKSAVKPDTPIKIELHKGITVKELHSALSRIMSDKAAKFAKSHRGAVVTP